MDGGTCPVCLGKGEVLVRLPIHSCKRCNATGHAIPSEPFLIVKAGRKLCSLCQGTGWLFAQLPGN
jgi:DnaJ-class molecular chaperone